jgi:hypothetical protein
MTATPDYLSDPPSGPQMNALLEILRTLRLSGGIFLDCEFRAPWCVTASAIGPEEVGLITMPFPAHVIAYHYVTHGRVLLQMANQQPVEVQAGEVVVFPTNDKHRLGSDLSIKASAPRSWSYHLATATSHGSTMAVAARAPISCAGSLARMRPTIR